MKKRNGKIEVLRFVFAICVVLLHTDQKIFDFKGLLEYGAMSVEFFFVLSGFLLGKHVADHSDRSDSDDTKDYIIHKVLRFLPNYILSFTFVFIIYCIKHCKSVHDFFLLLLRILPDFMLLREWGWSAKLLSIIGPTWYLSVLIICTVILYPLCRKNETWFKYGAFIVGSLLIGCLRLKYNELISPYVIVLDGMMYKGLVRGFAEMCLGISCYHVSEMLKKYTYTKIGKFALSMIELVSFFLVLYVVLLSNKPEYNIYALIGCLFMITIIFTEKTYGSDLFDHPISYYLGKLSLSLYLSHWCIIGFFRKDNGFIHGIDSAQKVLIPLLSAVLLAMLVDRLSDKIKKIGIKRFFIEENNVE